MDLDSLTENKPALLRADIVTGLREILLDKKSRKYIAAIADGEWRTFNQLASIGGSNAAARALKGALNRIGMMQSKNLPRERLGQETRAYAVATGFKELLIAASDTIQPPARRRRVQAELGFTPNWYAVAKSAPSTPYERDYFNRHHLSLVSDFIKFARWQRDRSHKKNYVIWMVDHILANGPQSYDELIDLGIRNKPCRRVANKLCRFGLFYKLRGGKVGICREYLPLMDYLRSAMNTSQPSVDTDPSNS